VSTWLAQVAETGPAQLSFAVAVGAAVAVHAAPAGMFCGAGHVTTGSVSSTSVSAVVQDDVFPVASLPAQVVWATPGADRLGTAGVHVVVGEGSHTSVTIGAGAHCAEHTFDGVSDVLTVLGCGHVIVGAMLSSTVTLVLHDAVFALASVAVHVTGVTPSGKVPDAGKQTTVGAPQLSVPLATTFALAPPPPVHSIVCAKGHDTAGFVVSTTVIVALQLAVLLAQSFTLQFIVWGPMPWKDVLHCVASAPSHASMAVAGVAAAAHCASAGSVWFSHEIVGACVSRTRIAVVHVADWPATLAWMTTLVGVPAHAYA
jgi:hypothetical protein